MKPIFKIFQELKEQIFTDNDCFRIEALPNIKHHKIGITSNDIPIFFIQCDAKNEIPQLDINLELISVQFNRDCQLINKGQTQNGVFKIISLKTNSISLQEYFLEIVYLIIKKLPPTVSYKELKIEIERLVNLFSCFSKTPIKTIQGLWSELFVIEESKDPNYLVQSWHKNPTDKFDFNDGFDKIEVKSTSKNRRIHHFSLEQLNPNASSDLIIASLFSIETGIGSTIFDLIKMIEKRLKNETTIYILNQIVAQSLGSDFEKAFEIFFDYQLAKDSLRFYPQEKIPTINIIDIPNGVVNVRFECDLTDLEYLKANNSKSKLHKSLF